MVKVLLGSAMMSAGVLLSFVPPFFWGPVLFFAGAAMLFGGLIGASAKTAKTVVAIGKEVARAQGAGNPAPSIAGALPAPDYDVAKWNTLKEFDDDIRVAASKLSSLGQRAEDRLAAAYLSLMDKSMLDAIVTKIHAEESRASADAAAASANIRLSFDDPATFAGANVIDYAGTNIEIGANGACRIFDKHTKSFSFFETLDGAKRFVLHGG